MLLFDQKNIEIEELLDLIPGNVCMLNEEGEIIYANSSWKNFYRPGIVANFPGLIVGSNYLDEESSSLAIIEPFQPVTTLHTQRTFRTIGACLWRKY